MSELLAPFGAPPEVVEEPDEIAHSAVAPASAGVTHEPVVITEQQVLFATAAAAVPLQPAKTRGWVSRVISAIAAAASVTSGEDRPKRQHYPPRYDFLEDARMAREMHRL
jgi:hypothetical protein